MRQGPLLARVRHGGLPPAPGRRPRTAAADGDGRALGACFPGRRPAVPRAPDGPMRPARRGAAPGHPAGPGGRT
jgi:hypothetical protein